jgi:hypothetical protein
MGFIDDISAEYANGDPELTRVFEQSYQEGIHSAWALALSSTPSDQNVTNTADSMKADYPTFSATNASSGLKQAFAPA